MSVHWQPSLDVIEEAELDRPRLRTRRCDPPSHHHSHMPPGEKRIFLRACELAHVKPTARQSAKWVLRKGAAFRFNGLAQSIVSREK